MIDLRYSLFIGGFVTLILGTLLIITLIGAIIGVPLLIIGAIMCFVSIFVPGSKVDEVVAESTYSGVVPETQVRCQKCQAMNPKHAIYCNTCGNKIE